MHYHLIINPKSGKDNTQQIIDTAKKRFASRRKKLTVTLTEKANHAESLAKNSKADVVIAAGGDGTINEVINGLLESKKKKILGILPVGTANMVARFFSVPLTIDGALECIFEGETKKIDLGVINGRNFTLAAGIGLDAHLFDTVKPQVKKMVGPAVYPLSGIRTAFEYHPRKITVKTSDLEMEGYYVAICNVGKYGPAWQMAPHAKIDDGLLDILVFEKKDVKDFVRYAMGIVGKYHNLMAGVKRFQTKKLTITTEEPVLIQADAEVIGTTPAAVHVLHKKLEIIKGSKEPFISAETLDTVKEKAGGMIRGAIEHMTLPHETQIFKKIKKTKNTILKKVVKKKNTKKKRGG